MSKFSLRAELNQFTITRLSLSAIKVLIEKQIFPLLHFVARERKRKMWLCLLRSLREKRQKNPKMSVKGSNWEWNRFFRKLNCCFSPLPIRIARYFKLRAVRHEIVGSGRNSTILNAKFVKSWISVASWRILKLLSCLRFSLFSTQRFHCFTSLIWCW